jgi:hypothetical protein
MSSRAPINGHGHFLLECFSLRTRKSPDSFRSPFEQLALSPWKRIPGCFEVGPLDDQTPVLLDIAEVLRVFAQRAFALLPHVVHDDSGLRERLSIHGVGARARELTHREAMELKTFRHD